MAARSVDRAVEGLARQQHGAFHRDQALQNGASPGLIRRRLATGAWVRLADSSVYALPSHPPTWRRQCVAATLSVPGSALAGAAAAALHGFPEAPRAPMELVTRGPTARRRRSPLAPVQTASWLEPFIRIDHVSVVTAADCTIQLIPRLAPNRLAALVETLAVDRRRYLDDLRARLAALDDAGARPPGIGRLRSLLDAADDAPPRSELERRLRVVLETTPGLPPVRWEATPPWYTPGEARVDALIPDWHLIVEADGRRWHTREADFERDRWRDNAAAVHGYAVLRFTWRSLTDDLAACRRLLLAFADRTVRPIGSAVRWRPPPDDDRAGARSRRPTQLALVDVPTQPVHWPQAPPPRRDRAPAPTPTPAQLAMWEVA